MDHNLFEFPITVYGEVTQFNDVMSKARCRIFYKDGNRNGTFIRENVAEKLVSTLSYVPIKGIYDGEDFTDHGRSRTEGRIYGIVPETHNFAWEEVEDEDGVTRTYACADVLLFTGLYKEAAQIVGKSLSMELFEPTLQYHWEFIRGQKWCVFDDASFLGLQVLGDQVEPCFEGAAFYELQQSIDVIVDKIKTYTLEYEKKQEEKRMDIQDFKLSMNDTFNAICSLLNTEDDKYYSVSELYDDYALAFEYSENSWYRIAYTKDDETDTIVLGEKKKCYIMDLTEEEKATVDTLRDLNGGNYELVNEVLVNAQSNFEKIDELGSQIVELNNSIATLTTERDTAIADNSELTTQYTAITERISELEKDNNELSQYKYNVELAQKKAIIAEYEAQLNNDILTAYTENIDKYTALELDMHLAYEVKQNNPTIYSQIPSYVPKAEVPKTGIEGILDRYRKTK